MRLSITGWAIGGLSSALVALVAPDVPHLLDDVAGSSFPDAAVAVASLVALAIAAWSALIVALILVAGSSRLVVAITPVMMRSALVAGAAGALAIGPAHAGPAEAPQAPRHTVDGLRLPDRPDVVEPVRRVSSPPPAVPVRAGDTLWTIAARTLPDGATDADIARATRQWHDANRDVIGDDPDLIFPTQHLTPPTGKDPS
jgi:hypothetical protein